MDGGDLVAGNQPVRLGPRHGRVALDVRDHQVQLGAAQCLDAAGGVDHVNCELGGIHAAHTNLRQTARDGIKPADIHRLRAYPRSGVAAKYARGDRAARCLFQERPAAMPPLAPQRLRCADPALPHHRSPFVFAVTARGGAVVLLWETVWIVYDLIVNVENSMGHTRPLMAENDPVRATPIGVDGPSIGEPPRDPASLHGVRSLSAAERIATRLGRGNRPRPPSSTRTADRTGPL